jgi:hypothetical protein
MAIALALMIASVASLAWLESQPRDAHTIAAIYPPWIGGDEAIDRVIGAGGAIVRLGIIGTVIVAHSDDPGLSDRLSASGAWAVIDPEALGGCLTREI